MMSDSSKLTSILAAIAAAPVFLTGPYYAFVLLDWPVAMTFSVLWLAALYAAWRLYRRIARWLQSIAARLRA